MSEPREWNGHKLFCGCNDDLLQRDLDQIDYPFPRLAPCPHCGLYRWYYLNPADEPRHDKEGA